MDLDRKEGQKFKRQRLNPDKQKIVETLGRALVSLFIL